MPQRTAKLVVHHLNDSRSQRILWLLEELGLDCDIRKYQRSAQTRFAPAELKRVHPLGKAPVLDDGGRVVIESGAIVDYLLRHYGNGRLQPALDSAEYDDYIQWLHFAEGSAMLPFLLKLYVSRLGDAGTPLHPRIESEIDNHLSFMDSRLEGRDFLVGEALTGADIQMSFVGDVAGKRANRAAYANVDRWIRGLHQRPAWRAALAKGGAYAFAD
jgi:glutathione S-transferase